MLAGHEEYVTEALRGERAGFVAHIVQAQRDAENRVVAGKLAQDPDRVLARARRNLERFQAIHAGATVVRWLDEWQGIIAQGPEAVMRTLTSEAPHAADLRQNSPFAGVLSESERRDVLESFTRHWERRAT